MLNFVIGMELKVSEPKRLLIISAMFFPQPAVGTVRVTQWCRYLPEFGWQPNVLCRYYGHQATPQLLAEKLHPAVSVNYFNLSGSTNTPPPSGQSNGLVWWKSLLANSLLNQWVVPDLSVVSWRGGRNKALELVGQLHPDVILTSSPPLGVHDLGLWLSTETGIPWVADFRDPYIIDSRYGPRGIGRLRYSAHRNYERQIYERAALIVHAIPLQARWARMTYPAARAKIVTLTNGCPPELFDGSLEPVMAANGRRSIRMVGALTRPEADMLVRATGNLIERGADLELRLVGGSQDDLSELQKQMPDNLVVTGALRHDQALAQVTGADVLVCSLSPARSKAMLLSSKLFEYLATGKPVIVINPTIPDRQFLRKFQGVRLLVAPSVEELEMVLRWALESASSPPLEQTRRFRQEFNRRTQTKQLADWLSNLAGE